MLQAGHQLQFFHNLKAAIPEHVSLVDRVAEVLHISEDSAYRRIRGDKQMALDEVYTLCRHFGLSLDRLLGRPSSSIIFSGKYIKPETFDFTMFMDNLIKRSSMISEVGERTRSRFFNLIHERIAHYQYGGSSITR